MKSKIILSLVFSLFVFIPFSRNIIKSISPKAVYIEEFEYNEIPKKYNHYFETETFDLYKLESYKTEKFVLMEGEAAIMKINGNFEILKSTGDNKNNKSIKITYNNTRFKAVVNGVKKNELLVATLTVTDLNNYQNATIKTVAPEIWGSSY